MTTCIIGLPVYNGAQYIAGAIKNIAILKTLFETVSVVFAYDSSTDNTLLLLQEYAKNNSDIVILFSPNRERKSNYRAVNIALARNRILNYIRCYKNKVNYFIMLDCNYNNRLTVDPAVLSRYLGRDDWDGLSFNQANYYDIWALSVEPYYLSCWAWSCGSAVSNVMKGYIKSVLSGCSDDELVPCISAFNGVAIYRAEKFLNCYYDGAYNTAYLSYLGCDLKRNIQLLRGVSQTIIRNAYVGKNSVIGNQDCEHRIFHAMAIIKNKARIRISPLCLLK